MSKHNVNACRYRFTHGNSVGRFVLKQRRKRWKMMCNISKVPVLKSPCMQTTTISTHGNEVGRFVLKQRNRWKGGYYQSILQKIKTHTESGADA